MTLADLQSLDDASLIERLAVEVMGWEHGNRDWMKDGKHVGGRMFHSEDDRCEHCYSMEHERWNPLTDWNHTIEAKRAAERKSGDCILFYTRQSGRTIAYQGTACADPDFGDYFVEDASPQRAICLAVLLAVSHE